MKVLVNVGILWLALLATEAKACSPSELPTTTAEIVDSAKSQFASAFAVIDAEVESPMAPNNERNGTVPAATMRILHIWKGDVPEIFPLFLLDSCDLVFPIRGQKLRLLLSRDDRLSAALVANGGATASPQVFDAEIDRLLGAKRPSDFGDARAANIPAQNRARIAPSKDASNNPFAEESVQFALLLVAVGSALISWIAARMLAKPGNP